MNNSFNRILTIYVFAILLQTLWFGLNVHYCLRNILSSQILLIYISLALYTSSGSLFATISFYNTFCYLLIQRIQCVNSTINQLLFGSTIGKEFLLLNSNQKILTHDFSYHFYHHRHHHHRKPNSNIKRLPFKRLHTVIFKSRTVRKFADAPEKRALNKIWAVKMLTDSVDINEMHNLDNLVSRFNLTDVKILSMM